VGDEFEVLGVDLVVVLRLFAGEDDIEGDLIGLVHDGAEAAYHFADVKVGDTGDVFEVFVAAGDDLGGGIGLGGVGPENDNVREHKYGGVFRGGGKMASIDQRDAGPQWDEDGGWGNVMRE
jgi:hypothetical protein